MRLLKFLQSAVIAWLAFSACVFSSPAFAGEAPRSVGVFGDSLGDGLWSGLYTMFKSHPDLHLYRYSKIGAGITRPDYATWFQDFTTALDDTPLTDAVIMVGANDRQGIRDEHRKGYVFQSEGWKRTYSERIDAILTELKKRKVAVIWVGLPVMRDEDLNSGAAVMNDIFSEGTKRAGATYLSLSDSFRGEDGAFAAYLPDHNGHLRQVRAEDGVHFTGYGYELLAAKIFTALSTPAPIQTAGVVAR